MGRPRADAVGNLREVSGSEELRSRAAIGRGRLLRGELRGHGSEGGGERHVCAGACAGTGAGWDDGAGRGGLSPRGTWGTWFGKLKWSAACRPGSEEHTS